MVTSQRAAQAAAKYRGDTATGYEARRQNQPKWQAEDRIVKEMLGSLPKGSSILDIPVGTGRFIPFYETRGFRVHGLDVSMDMLELAARKVHRPDLIQIKQGDIFAIDLQDKSVDAAIAIRIMNKIGEEDMAPALRELQRVARDLVIFNLRIWTPVGRWRHSHKLEAALSALQPGWSVAEDVEIHERDFMMIRLAFKKPVADKRSPVGEQGAAARGSKARTPRHRSTAA